MYIHLLQFSRDNFTYKAAYFSLAEATVYICLLQFSWGNSTYQAVYFSLAEAALHMGPYAPQGSTSLLPKLSVTSKVSARTSYAWVGSRVHFWSSEDVTLLEFTSPIDHE